MTRYVNRRLLASAISQGLPLKQITGRGIGTTTGIILRAISDSIRCPGEAVYVHDTSWAIDAVPTPSQLRDLKRRTIEVIESLGLTHITVSALTKGALTITNNFAEVIS